MDEIEINKLLYRIYYIEKHFDELYRKAKIFNKKVSKEMFKYGLEINQLISKQHKRKLKKENTYLYLVNHQMLSKLI